MSSQKDLDQGGTNRQWTRSYMGPSVGWVYAPLQNVLLITTAGTTVLDPSTSLVEVNVAVGAVTIKLPSAIQPAAGATAQPGLFVSNPITIVDVGGNAGSNAITIIPVSGAETILGLASIQISVNYGGYTLQPNSAQKTWNSILP